MKRDIDLILEKWKNSQTRQPLLIRGARQIGKTYSIISFGNKRFDNCVNVNFEEQPEYKQCFNTLDPWQIINKISLLSNNKIIPGNTLLFLDEIQECPEAILALRYFYEKFPQLHITGAGSLLELAAKSEDFRMPVGRIQNLFMYPVSFGEYLDAIGKNMLREYLQTIKARQKIEPVHNNELIEQMRNYMLLGGMPKIIDSFINKINIEEIKNLQINLLRTYQDDFAKYSRTSQHKYLKEVFMSAPGMVGKRYKYSNINPAIQTRFLKEAVNILSDARCIKKINHSAGNGIPLEAEVNSKKYKIIFLDIGLMQRSLGLDTAIVFKEKIHLINEGSLAEQYIGQELSAYECDDEKKLYTWFRDKKGSTAEIDYLIDISGVPVPIEVKSGKTGSLKSMRLFLDEHPKSRIGIRFSLHDLSFHDNILSIPLFLAGQTTRLFNECCF